jgi:GTPase SAR1 family protein
MSEDIIDIKIALIGDCSVGKTSLINAFVHEEF